MRLTPEEFAKIRPLEWRLVNYGNRVYNTTISETSRQLFWLDFMRLIFAPKFRKQNGVLKIPQFDINNQVLLTDDLELELPPDLETAMYYANNPTVPIRFAFNVSQLTVALIAVTLIILIVFIEHVVSQYVDFALII